MVVALMYPQHIFIVCNLRSYLFIERSATNPSSALNVLKRALGPVQLT